MSIPKHAPSARKRDGLAAPTQLQWAMLGSFVLVLAFLGGSSRSDVAHNIVLRPAAALLSISAVYSLRLVDFERDKALLLLMMAAIFWIILQLVPIPPFAWRALADREFIAKIDDFVGYADMWRPISLASFRGFDSAFAMIVPMAGLVLAVSAKASQRMLLSVVAVLGLLNASLGLLQFFGGSDSPFYIFPGASPGALEGIFGNENHSAVFSAIALLVISRLALDSELSGNAPWQRLSLGAAFGVILLTVLISGSRAGLIATLASLLAIGAMSFMVMPRTDLYIGSAADRSSFRKRGRATLVTCSAAIVMVIFAFVWFERSLAFGDITERNAFEDLRWSLWPVLREMSEGNWLFGTGFGSFEAIYRLYEPSDLLFPAYVNHAHNDWAQLVIEGGLPAMVLLASLLWWIVAALVDLGKGGHASRGRMIFWVALVMIFAAASLIDYPLRTPIFQATVVWLLMCLSFDRSSADKR